MRALWILLLAMAARDALGFECRRRLLAPEELRALDAFVLETRGIAIDPNTIVACSNFDSVVVYTVHAPQSDGSDRFARLSCWRERWSKSVNWQCVGEPDVGFRMDTYPGELGIWVGIATPTALDLARRLAGRAIEVLGHEGVVPYCQGGVGSQTRTLASLRREITGGDGVVMLGRQQGRFWLSGGKDVVTIEFIRDPDDNVRVDCWYLEEIIVTG